jgi:hypothetical protein
VLAGGGPVIAHCSLLVARTTRAPAGRSGHDRRVSIQPFPIIRTNGGFLENVFKLIVAGN